MSNAALVKNPIEDLRNSIQAMQPQFEMALPPQITAERFIRVTMTAIQTNADLLKADRKSLFSACMKAAQDGLLPDGREAALVTYNTRENGVVAQYMPMIGGILKKVRNSGVLASITSQMIYEKDKFRFWVDDSGEHIEHDPLLFADRGKVVGVYALAKTKDGAVYIEVMNSDQVQKVRASSRAKNGPWSGPFEHEMWRKTAIRRLSKRLPMSTDLEDVIQRDDDLYDHSRADQDGIADKGRKLAQMIGTEPAPALPEPETPSEPEAKDPISEEDDGQF